MNPTPDRCTTVSFERSPVSRFLALLATLAITLCLGTPVLGATAGGTSATRSSLDAYLIALIDGYRGATGRQPLAANAALTGAAVWMAQDMASHSYIGHISSDGRTPVQRLAAFGYPSATLYTGEDLAAGYATAAAVLAGWRASPAHDAVLENASYDAIGVGVVYDASTTYKWFWAADFGGPGGTVRVVAPIVPAPSAAPPRVAAAPRGTSVAAAAAPDAPDETASAAIAPVDRLGARRIDHLFAVLARIGWL
jgi:uncharacterized protein YkwD